MQKCDFNKVAKQCAHIIVMFIQKIKKDIAEVHIHVTRPPIHRLFAICIYQHFEAIFSSPLTYTCCVVEVINACTLISN